MSNPYEDVTIKVFAAPQAEHRVYDTRDEDQIIDLIRSHVLPREKAAVHSVNVKVKRQEDGAPGFLIAYLLRANTYTADVVKVDVDANFQVQGFEDNYVDLEDDKN